MDKQTDTFFFFKRKNKSMFIRGPHTMTVHTIGTGREKKKVIIFGENHFRMTGCSEAGDAGTTSILDFIREYIDERNPGQVDLFLESVYVPQKKDTPWFRKLWHDLSTMTRDKLVTLRKTYDVCAPKWADPSGIVKSSVYRCPPNLRVHLCDIRQIYHVDSTQWTEDERVLVDKMVRFFEMSTTFPVAELTKNSLHIIMSLFKRFLFDKKDVLYHKHAIPRFMKCIKIDKQLDAIPNKKFRNVLQTSFQHAYKKIIRDMSTAYRTFLKQCIHAIVDFLPDQYADAFLCDEPVMVLLNQLMRLQTRLMDMYLMGRLLRRFQDGTTAKDSIIYVGDAHANYYRTVLRKMGAKCTYAYPKNVDTMPENQTGFFLADTCVRPPSRHTVKKV